MTWLPSPCPVGRGAPGHTHLQKKTNTHTPQGTHLQTLNHVYTHTHKHTHTQTNTHTHTHTNNISDYFSHGHVYILFLRHGVPVA